jgi:hypothetical protein
MAAAAEIPSHVWLHHDWLWCDVHQASRVAGIDVEFLQAWDQTGFLRPSNPAIIGGYLPRDLAKLLVLVQLLEGNVDHHQAAEAAEKAADHVVWYGVMKGVASILVSGTHEMVQCAHILKKNPDYVEAAIGGKPQHHPYAKPAVHRFLMRADGPRDLGWYFHLEDDVGRALGKLKAKLASTLIVDLRYLGEHLVDKCGPLIEFHNSCPLPQRMFAFTDLSKMSDDDPLSKYHHPLTDDVLCSPTFGGGWLDENY